MELYGNWQNKPTQIKTRSHCPSKLYMGFGRLVGQPTRMGPTKSIHRSRNYTQLVCDTWKSHHRLYFKFDVMSNKTIIYNSKIKIGESCPN